MALKSPPPYFPQGALSPPDPKRYRKFKMILLSVGVIGLIVILGLVAGLAYLTVGLFS